MHAFVGSVRLLVEIIKFKQILFVRTSILIFTQPYWAGDECALSLVWPIWEVLVSTADVTQGVYSAKVRLSCPIPKKPLRLIPRSLLPFFTYFLCVANFVKPEVRLVWYWFSYKLESFLASRLLFLDQSDKHMLCWQRVTIANVTPDVEHCLKFSLTLFTINCCLKSVLPVFDPSKTISIWKKSLD